MLKVERQAMSDYAGFYGLAGQNERLLTLIARG